MEERGSFGHCEVFDVESASFIKLESEDVQTSPFHLGEPELIHVDICDPDVSPFSCCQSPVDVDLSHGPLSDDSVEFQHHSSYADPLIHGTNPSLGEHSRSKPVNSFQKLGDKSFDEDTQLVDARSGLDATCFKDRQEHDQSKLFERLLNDVWKEDVVLVNPVMELIPPCIEDGEKDGDIIPSTSSNTDIRSEIIDSQFCDSSPNFPLDFPLGMKIRIECLTSSSSSPNRPDRRTASTLNNNVPGTMGREAAGEPATADRSKLKCERERRHRLKLSLDRLRACLPTLYPQKSMVEVLNSARSYCFLLQNVLTATEIDRHRLLMEKKYLASKLESLSY